MSSNFFSMTRRTKMLFLQINLFSKKQDWNSRRMLGIELFKNVSMFLLEKVQRIRNDSPLFLFKQNRLKQIWEKKVFFLNLSTSKAILSLKFCKRVLPATFWIFFDHFFFIKFLSSSFFQETNLSFLLPNAKLNF